MGNPSLRWVTAGVGLACSTLCGAPLCAQVDATLAFNQHFQGTITEQTDADLIEFTEVEGSKLTLTATRTSASVSPKVELLDASMSAIDTAGFEAQTSITGAVKEFPAPYSGTYFARVSAANGLTGNYELKVKGDPKSTAKGLGVIGVAGEVDVFGFHARAGSTVSGVIKRKSGDLQPYAVELIGPDGGLISLFGKTGWNETGTVLKLDTVPLPLLGGYALKITGQAGTTGDYKVKLHWDAAKPVKGDLFEVGHPDDPGNTKPSVTLQEVYFGRGLRTPDGLSLQVVNPLSLVLTDPISGLPLADSLEPLFPGVDLGTPSPFGLGPLFAAPVVPRNGVLLLRFNKKISVGSLNLIHGRLGPSSPIQLSCNGSAPEIGVFVSGKDVILDPVTPGASGFPPSPFALDSSGNPVASATGNSQLTLSSVGPVKVRSLDGGEYKARQDLLGSPDAGGPPIGFNSGNQALDFFKVAVAGSGVKGYSGFLPDDRAPRIIREYRHDGTYTPDLVKPSKGDVLSAQSLAIVDDFAFDVNAKGGDGEWAGGILRLRPGASDQEELVISRNTVVPLGGGLFRNELSLESVVLSPLGAGQPYAIVRSEYFEPDAQVPLDPALYDPFNPENANNTDLSRFVELLDRDGVVQDPHQPVDPLSSVRVRFNEAMSAQTLRAYESFQVTPDESIPTPGVNLVGRVELSDGGRVATYRPEREIQFGPAAGTFEVVGFGPGPTALRFSIKVVPPADVIQAHVGQTGLSSFLAQGEVGVTDVGGQPLAYPAYEIYAAQLTLQYSFAFSTWADASLAEHGAVVHRFKGAPKTGFGSNGDAGVTFEDMPTSLCGPGGNLYGPRIADVNLFSNGFLAGAAVQFIQKIHDDFNPPPSGPFSPFAFGTSTPIGGNSVLGGARMQHIYRAVDASPDHEALAGTILDLAQLAYAPSGGSVFNTTIKDFQVHAGHSNIVPDVAQNMGIPSMPDSGMTEANSPANSDVMGGHYQTLGDPNTPYVKGPYNATVAATGKEERRQLLYGSLKPGAVADSYDGKPFVIDNSQLFQPPGTSNIYHPLPHTQFDHFFPYNNGAEDAQVFGAASGHTNQISWGGKLGDRIPQSLVLEYRVRVVDSDNPPATGNSFTFAVGVLSSALPRFRAYTFGTACSSCCTGATEGGNGVGCKNTCSYNIVNPALALTGLPGSQGPPLEPDLIKIAAGPNPAVPSLACFCLPGPNLTTTCAAGTHTATTAPSIDQVAYGATPAPPGLNYGDNSRYFMLFHYVKRESTIRSPFVAAQQTTGNPMFLAPIFDPPLSDLPVGTAIDVRFRTSALGLGTPGDTTSYVTPDEMVDTNNVLNTTPNTPFIQFQMVSEGNASTQLAPVLEQVVIPFLRN